LMAFSQSRSAVLSIIVMAFLGFGLFVAIANSNIVLQTVVDDDKRGRVLGLSTMSVIGMAPLGSIFVGALSSRLGAQMTVFLGGLAFFIAALIFARKTPWPTSEANLSGVVAGTESAEPIGP
jgi:predicted MFS family arabinose efflux permease